MNWRQCSWWGINDGNDNAEVKVRAIIHGKEGGGGYTVCALVYIMGGRGQAAPHPDGVLRGKKHELMYISYAAGAPPRPPPRGGQTPHTLLLCGRVGLHRRDQTNFLAPHIKIHVFLWVNKIFCFLTCSFCAFTKISPLTNMTYLRLRIIVTQLIG